MPDVLLADGTPFVPGMTIWDAGGLPVDTAAETVDLRDPPSFRGLRLASCYFGSRRAAFLCQADFYRRNAAALKKSARAQEALARRAEAQASEPEPTPAPRPPGPFEALGPLFAEAPDAR